MSEKKIRNELGAIRREKGSSVLRFLLIFVGWCVHLDFLVLFFVAITRELVFFNRGEVRLRVDSNNAPFLFDFLLSFSEFKRVVELGELLGSGLRLFLKVIKLSLFVFLLFGLS